MLLTLSSDQFVFRRAQVLVLRWDALEATLAQVHCRENAISNLDIHGPGAYSLWLSEMEIQAPSNLKSVQLSGLLVPWVVEFSQEDLDRGTKTVAAPPGGMFRITVVGGQHVAVPHHKLIAAAGEKTLEIQMDANGMQVTYGNPTQCVFVIDPGFGILIEHLDTATL